MASGEDNRRLCRLAVLLKGRLSGPKGTVNCTLVDISPLGAAVRGPTLPAGSRVVLDIERIGPVPAICVEHEKGILRLEFDCPEARRRDIALTLERLVENDLNRAPRFYRAGQPAPTLLDDLV